MKAILFVVHYVELFLGVFTFVSLVFQFTVRESVFVIVGAWRNRQAARRTLRLLYRIATTCPECGHPALASFHGQGFVCAGSGCVCRFHGAWTLLPQPPGAGCWP